MSKDCSPTCETQPPMIWPTAAGSIPARSTAARWATPRRSAGCSPARPPLRRPIGVRTAERMTTSCMAGVSREAPGESNQRQPCRPRNLRASKARHMARRAVEDARPPCTAGPSATARTSMVSATGVRASSRSTTRATSRYDRTADGGPGIDLLDLVRRPRAARPAHAAPDPLLRHPRRPHPRPRRRFEQGHHASTATRAAYRGVYPDQGEPAAPRGRGDRRVRRRRTRSASRPAASPSCSIALARARHAGRADHLQRLQGPHVHRDRAARAAPRPHADHRRRPLPRARPHRQDVARARHPAAHRRARAPHDARAPASGSNRPATASKFGLTAVEIVEAVDRLRAEDMLDCLELLHFHIGSQITAIRAHKDALREASRIFVELHKMGATPQRTSTSAAGSASTTTARRRTSTRR